MTARKERPLMRMERGSVITLVIYVNKSLILCTVAMVNKWLICPINRKSPTPRRLEIDLSNRVDFR